jgi:hypothetical protein
LTSLQLTRIGVGGTISALLLKLTNLRVLEIGLHTASTGKIRLRLGY